MTETIDRSVEKGIQEMNWIALNYYTSLYDMLWINGDDLAKYVKNVRIMEQTGFDCEFQYPYLGFLNLKIELCTERRYLLDSINSLLSEGTGNVLPHLVYEQIANRNLSS